MLVAGFCAGCGGGADPPPAGLRAQIPQAGDVDPPPYEPPYVIEPDDELRIMVLASQDLNSTAPVRPDGNITVPGAGEVKAAGLTPEELSGIIEARLSSLLRHPDVSVVVTRTKPRGVFVTGEVFNSRELGYRPGMTLLQALTGAGGLRSSAKTSSILLMRRTGPEDVSIRRVDVKAILDREEGSVDPIMAPFDIVYVPRTFIASAGQFINDFIRPASAPISLYTQAWWAVNLSSSTVRVTLQ